ncbi:MAG: glycosyltransferase family 2 protein [Burkholderiales bacterium]
MIVPILCGPETLTRMVKSIDFPVAHLIIIDNGLCLHSLKVASAYVGRVDVIPLPANLGVAASWNLGVKVSPMSPWWMIANYDIVFEPGSMARFHEQSNRHGILLGGHEWDWQHRWSCFTVGEDIIRDVGLWDERFFPAYFEDTDYERRLGLNGIVPRVVDGAPFLHEHNSTAKANEGMIESTYHKNKKQAQYIQQDGTLREGPWLLDVRREREW